MYTVIKCECGEEAILNQNPNSMDASCNHCGAFNEIKYNKSVHTKVYNKTEDTYTKMIRNRREYHSKNYRRTEGFW